MVENLNYAADGSMCYGNDSIKSILWPNEHGGLGFTPVGPGEVCDYYGRLYDWNTVMNGESSSNAVPSGVEGVCPVGWHVPSDAEWAILVDYVGINAGTKLKARSVRVGGGHPDGTDKYRFSALLGGIGSELSNNFFPSPGEGPPYFHSLGRAGYWWSSTDSETDRTKAWWRAMGGEEVGRQIYDKHYMVSVRCVHD